MVPDPHDGLGRLLRSLPREIPPDPGLDAIFERWQHQRRRSVAGAGLVAAILIALGIFWRPTHDVAPPVHLDIRVVDVTTPDGGPVEFLANPEEGNGP